MKTLVFTNGYLTVPLVLKCSDVEDALSQNFDKGWLCINSYTSVVDDRCIAIKINTVGEYYGLYIPDDMKSNMSHQNLEQMLMASGHIG